MYFWLTPKEPKGQYSKQQQRLSTEHPSPLSATKFFGNKHFSQTNDWLVKIDKEPVDWR